MAHTEQRNFCEKVKEKYPYFFKNKKVLDIGSLDINGSNKELFENCEYIGLDVGEGKNVDVVCVGHMYDAPDNYFDTIISTEVFEHDMFYEKTIKNIIRMLKPGGLFLFTCAAPNRPEHGTRRKGQFDAPSLIQISEDWADYYKNLTEADIREIPSFNDYFPDGTFKLNNEAMIGADLYFFGIKGGSKYLINDVIPQFSNEKFKDDIFIIDSWPDTESKENDLIGLIKILKTFNTTILLSGHYPIKAEIQKMVDFYIFDSANPILVSNEFEKYNVNSGRWTTIGNVHIENKYKFHHDYSIWTTMKNSFNFAKSIGKKYIHFFEYDSLPDPIQYRQSFLEELHNGGDAVIYEYRKGSMIDTHLAPYCSTFIFSIKTDVALNIINQITTKEQYFYNRPKGWQLERIFLECLKNVTSDIKLSKYIANSNELNTQAVWNRDGVDRNGAKFQIYLAVDINDNLYMHTISGFHEDAADDDYLIEINYRSLKKFYTIKKNQMDVFKIGKYGIGYSVIVYHQGVEVYREFLGSNVNEFRKLNEFISTDVIKENNDVPKTININFIDGPFVEIIDNTEKSYQVQFINKKGNNIEYETKLKSNHWAKSSKKYYANWKIKIKGIDNDYNLEYDFDVTDKVVLIGFESKALGDTLAWMPYVEKFRVDKKCKVICSTFHNNLFEKQYPHIQFVVPGSSVNDIYALYRIGLFYTDKKIDYSKHPTDPLDGPLAKMASDILGLDYEELKPQIPVLSTKKKKMVSIAIHATAQCKYWNNPTGWQDVVNFLNNNGYEVRLLSREENGYMGNRNPKGVIKEPTPKIEDVLRQIQQSELFIGISSGLSWLSWAGGTKTMLISGFTDVFNEPMNDTIRIINKDVCNGCWHKHTFDPGDWNWCPVHKGTDRQFECSKSITSEQVINEIKKVLNL